MSDQEQDAEAEETPQPRGFKSFTAADVQKVRLDKLMKNIDKPIEIPKRGLHDRKFPDAPDFVRNVMGSSAGAGSGEFHVYRHLRRKEFARQRFIDEQARKEKLDDAYQVRLTSHQKTAEERTAKKRAKRLKKKQRGRQAKKGSAQAKKDDDDDDEDDSETEEEEEKVDEDKPADSVTETPAE